jgi:hypothetical protein
MRQLLRIPSRKRALALAEKIVRRLRQAWDRGEKVKLGTLVRQLVDEALGVDSRGGGGGKADSPTFTDVLAGWSAAVWRMTYKLERLPAGVLEDFALHRPDLVKDFTEKLEALVKVWEVTRPAPRPRMKVVTEA